MVQYLSHNPDTDIAEVDQFGFVDITKAFQNGYVPGDNSSVSLEFDDCDDPSAIIGKPSDAFEAMRMQDSLMKGISRVGESDGSSEGTKN